MIKSKYYTGQAEEIQRGYDELSIVEKCLLISYNTGTMTLDRKQYLPF